MASTPGRRPGWSVCIHGVGREITLAQDAEACHLRTMLPTSWAPGIVLGGSRPSSGDHGTPTPVVAWRRVTMAARAYRRRDRRGSGPSPAGSASGPARRSPADRGTWSWASTSRMVPPPRCDGPATKRAPRGGTDRRALLGLLGPAPRTRHVGGVRPCLHRGRCRRSARRDRRRRRRPGRGGVDRAAHDQRQRSERALGGRRRR